MGSKKFKRKSRNKKLCKISKRKKNSPDIVGNLRSVGEYHCSDHFPQIRENYFNYLQNVIKENLEYSPNEVLNSSILERISLEVEQRALLACMRSDVYQKIMIKIIQDIRKSTQKMKLDIQLQNIMPSNCATEIDVDHSVINNKEYENSVENRTHVQMYSHIPTILCTRTDDGDFGADWSNENALPDEYEMCSNMEAINNGSHILHPTIISGITQDAYENDNFLFNCHSKQINGKYSVACNSSRFTPSYNQIINNCQDNLSPDNVDTMTNNNTFCAENLVPLLSYNCGHSNNVKENNVYHNNNNNNNSNNSGDIDHADGDATDNNDGLHKTFSSVPVNIEDNTELILKSRSQLQKSVEKSLINLKKINVQKKEERDRAQIAKILEDEDASNGVLDNQYDSLSDNCDEQLVNIPERCDKEKSDLLLDRLEEMRQIFGMDDDDNDNNNNNNNNNDDDDGDDVLHHHHHFDDDIFNAQREITKMVMYNCKKDNALKISQKKVSKNVHLWYHEKVIQMHKLSLLASEMTIEMKHRNKSLFLNLFGEDSDEENELDYYSEDKYLASCKERISSWVVKYLMPFYNKKRIVGRNVFKSLGHHISSSIIEQIQYPDEWTVKYFVTKFFPLTKQIVNESDIWFYQIR